MARIPLVISVSYTVVHCCVPLLVTVGMKIRLCRFPVCKINLSLGASVTLFSLMNLNVSHSVWPRHMGWQLGLASQSNEKTGRALGSSQWWSNSLNAPIQLPGEKNVEMGLLEFKLVPPPSRSGQTAGYSYIRRQNGTKSVDFLKRWNKKVTKRTFWSPHLTTDNHVFIWCVNVM